MSWYVLQCKTGQEEKMVRSCQTHLTKEAVEEVFTFQCERLWRTEGHWIPLTKCMFPGYIFLQSSFPEALSKELKQYRKILRVLEEPGYLISVYEEEEEALRALCGENHTLGLSYGYKDEKEGRSRIIKGPLTGEEDKLLKVNWHKRIAILGMKVARKEAVIWAGIEIAPPSLREKIKETKSLVS